MINIDLEKCIGCLKCVSVCPFKVIDIEEGKPKAKDKLCVKCLHCAAACSENAISLDNIEGVLPEEMPAFPDNFQQLMEGFLMTRRSYRHFKPEPVPKEIMSNALRVSAWAPSAKNQHPTKWIVVNDEKKISKIMEYILQYVRETGNSPEIEKLYESGLNVVLGNAKTILIAYAKIDSINPPVDTALALYNAELVLQSQGIGTCWAGYLTRLTNQIPALKDFLKIPEGFQLYGAMMAGYPENEEYIHIPNRQKQPIIDWL